MMDKNAFFDSIRGQMIISCQAVKGEPLYEEERSVMYLMARAAKVAGTPAIRTSSIRDGGDQGGDGSAGDRFGQDSVSRL